MYDPHGPKARALETTSLMEWPDDPAPEPAAQVPIKRGRCCAAACCAAVVVLPPAAFYGAGMTATQMHNVSPILEVCKLVNMQKSTGVCRDLFIDQFDDEVKDQSVDQVVKFVHDFRKLHMEKQEYDKVTADVPSWVRGDPDPVKTLTSWSFTCPNGPMFDKKWNNFQGVVRCCNRSVPLWTWGGPGKSNS
jgi:hypothetical protein